MARQLVSRLTLALALTSSMAFLGCAEEPKPTPDTATPSATPSTETPKEGASAPGAPAEKPAEAPK